MANRNFLAYIFPESNNMSLFFNKEKFDLSSFLKKIFLKLFKTCQSNPGLQYVHEVLLGLVTGLDASQNNFQVFIFSEYIFFKDVPRSFLGYFNNFLHTSPVLH